MPSISQEEFKKKYGDQALASFNKPQEQGGYLGGVTEAFKGGIGRVKQGIEEANPTGQGGVTGLATGVGKIMGGAVGAAFSPIAPAMEATLGKGINYAGEALSNIKPLQEWGRGVAEEGIPADQETGPERFVGAVQDYSAGLGVAAGGVGVPRGTGAIRTTAARVPKVDPLVAKASGYVKATAQDVLPSGQRMINHQVSQALDLTPGDLNNIFRSTGNDTGAWLSEHNLIKGNKEATQGAVKDFFKQNYEGVRNEIGKVDTEYKPYQLPRFTDALTQIKNKVTGVPGLEKVAVDVANLLIKKDKIKLSDVQHVKELMDDHFSLYKATGEVSDTIAKEGLANIRRDLQTFIEKEVKAKTGADIREMNRNVMTAKSLDEAITTRSQRGLTRSNWTKGDTPLAVFAIFNPLVGIPAFLIKKAYETPTVRLRIARYIDQLSDARRARVEAQLKANVLPPEIKEIIQGKPVSGSGSASPNVSTLMDKAKGALRTIKTEGKKGHARFFEPLGDKGPIADSVLQVAHKDGTSSFYRIPKDQFEAFKTQVDDGQVGMAGIATKEGDIYHLTAKTPEQMIERGFVDKGTADIGQLPKKVTSHERGGSGVKEYVRGKEDQRLYHGTDKEFKEFNPDANPDDFGTWFAPDRLEIDEIGMKHVHERTLKRGVKLVTEEQLSKEMSKSKYDKMTFKESIKASGIRGVKYDDGSIQLYYPNEDTL